MAEIPQSPEAVALALLKMVADVEKKELTTTARGAPDRKYILDTYAECLEAARGVRIVRT